MSEQAGDVRLFQTNDDGDISVIGGVVEMGGGLETTVYLMLFGGNDDDDGSADSTSNWWGNTLETEPSKQYRSATQYLLHSLPLTSGNLPRISDAVKQDTQELIVLGIASSVDIDVSIPALNTVKIVLKIEAYGSEQEFEFVENWKAES